MKALRHWKVILVLLLVFAAGAVLGGVVTMRFCKQAFARGFDVEHKVAGIMNDLQRDLQLTPEQRPKLKAILLDTGHRLEGNFGRAMRESGTNVVATWRQIEAELTPDQRAIFQRKCQKFRDGVKQDLKIDLPRE